MYFLLLYILRRLLQWLFLNLQLYPEVYPQGSILGSLLYLIYVNDMSQAFRCHFFLHANDLCLVYQYKDINEIEKQLNINFSNICDLFVDNKLSIHFGENKTKLIPFAFKFKKKNIKKLNIKYGDIQIKQHSKVKYLGCLMDEIVSGEAMTLNVIHKINNKLHFFIVKVFFWHRNWDAFFVIH